MHDICFFTSVNSSYQKYIPWHIYFILKSYPEASVMIALSGTLNNRTQRAIDLLDGNFTIIQKAFPEYECNNQDTIKCLRWLTLLPQFLEHEYMLIGDVDMAICRESPSLIEQHIRHCESLGLPYSNFIRPETPTRMSGVHFIKTGEWFDSTTEQRKKFLRLLRCGGIKFNNPKGHNEQLLYSIIKESEIGLPPASKPFRFMTEDYSRHISSHHHGIHIRAIEHGGFNRLKQIPGYIDFSKQIIGTCKDPVFIGIDGIFPEIGKHIKFVAKCYERLGGRSI